jgi:hypothetical protein
MSHEKEVKILAVCRMLLIIFWDVKGILLLEILN